MAETTDLDKLSDLLTLVSQMIQELRHGRAKNTILVQELDKLTKGPTVHVPINVHTAMNNRIATLQEKNKHLDELLKTAIRDRDGWEKKYYAERK